MSQNQTTKNIKKKNVLIIFLLSSAAFAQIALFQNCGNMKTATSSVGSSGTPDPVTTYAWQLSAWTSCSSPSCVQQTRTATCMKTEDGITSVEPNSLLCGTQNQSLSQSCGVTVAACNTTPGTCTNSGSPVCVNGRLMQARTCSPVGSICSGGCPTLDTGSCGTPTTNGNLFVPAVTAGTTDITLHPQSSTILNQPTNVVFGIPFPKGFVASTANIRVLNSANSEVPSFVTAINYWRNFQTPATTISLKSVQIGITYTFTDRNPVTMRVQWGTARANTITSTFSAASTWVPISNGVNPSEYPASGNVQEPRVYVTHSPSWLSQSLLKTRTTALNEVSSYNWFDTEFSDFSTQAANATAHQTTSEPWLYDRAQTLYFMYFRSGSVDWLRRGHRASQFYKANINSSGGFVLGGDSKYVYGQSMLYDMMITGDTSLIPVIERTRLPHNGWPTTFSASTGFWTERNQAYAMLAALAAFDATGLATDATRATALFNNVFNMQQNPGNGWTRIGCPLHTRNQHDPSEPIPDVMCSPWMGALIADAVWRYYILSLDNNALIYLADYGDYIHNYGLVTEGGLRIPYYASSYLGNTGSGEIDHACDVMGATVKAYWAKEALGRNSATMATDASALLTSCQANLSSSSISPARKYSWWFGTNSDFGWLLSNLP
ncbi:MAG: hypothetical protein V4596_05875 [Bdellovibrionota bacterium]